MITKEEWERRKREFESFNRWEEEQEPLPERPLDAVFADLSMLWRQVPEQERLTDPDPEKKGIREFREKLEHLQRWMNLRQR